MQREMPTASKNRWVKHAPIFYGWVVWVVATLGWLATSPGQAFSIGLFVDHFIRDFGLNRTTISSLFAAGTLVGAFSLTWIGRQIDRYGNRKVGIVVCIVFALALIAWGGVASPIAILVGFIAIRTLGQGALTLISTSAIANWFSAQRGVVMSVSLMIFALWQAAYVPFVQHLLETTDWHIVWIVLGVGVGAIVLPLLALLLRNRPEDHGMLPDGATLSKINHKRVKSEDNWTLSETIHTPIFWIFVMGRIISPAWGSGMIFHNVSIFATANFTAQEAAGIFSLITLTSAACSVMFGFMVDRMRPGLVMALQLSALLLSMVAGTNLAAPHMATLYAVGFGLVIGGGSVFDTSVWTNLFGRAHQGEIRGFVTTIIIASTALGPIMFGWCYDTLGSYAPMFWLGLGLTFIPLVLSLFTDKPRHRYPVAQPQGAGD